jgi:oligopeptidase A
MLQSAQTLSKKDAQTMFQEFESFTTEALAAFPKRLESLLDDQRDQINTLLQESNSTYDTILKPMQEMDESLSLFFTPLSHLNAVMNSQETQKAYEASIPLLSKYHSEIAQNEKLFETIQQIKTDEPEPSRVLLHEVRDFVLSGAALPLEAKKRLEAINLELSKLSNRFSQNLLDATNDFELILTEERDIQGIPASDLEAAREMRDGQTVYVFTLQIPSYLAYMTYGPNRSYRERLYRAYNTRAPENAEVIDRLLMLRAKKAQLLGFESYAAYALQTRDAQNQADVVGFLEELADAALPQAKEELAALRAYAERLDGLCDLQGYDVAYYSEKLKKEHFCFDETMIKPYFEQSKVLQGLLDIVSELFGVRFATVDVPVWHACVRVYDIYEEEILAGRIYFDLEARKEKRGGAWMSDWETHFIDTKGHKRLPSAFVVCNFSPTTPKHPSLLRHDDVVTLFHEMGHAIHHLFGRCNERSISGINGVAWDVVEFPSQFLENFAYEAPILERFAQHYESGEAISKTLLEKIKASKNFQAALGILRQVEFSLFDFQLHQRLYQGEEVQVLLKTIRQKTSLLMPPPENRFQHGFAHIFSGGYAAGYYSYKWAEVLSADAFFACLDPEGGFDQIKAQGYKAHILAKGAAEHMSELYHAWLGRKPKLESLIRLYDITPHAVQSSMIE